MRGFREGLQAACSGTLAFAGVDLVLTLVAARASLVPRSALGLSFLELALGAIAGLLALPITVAHARRSRPPPTLGRLLWLAASFALLVWALSLAVRLHPALEPHVPWRHLFGAFAFVMGVLTRERWWPSSSRTAVALPCLLGAAIPLTLATAGKDAGVKALAIGGSPPLRSLMALVRSANDFDRDGYGSLLGENDCAPFDPHVHPLAPDAPDDGIDQNCDGQDFRSIAARRRLRAGLPVPPSFGAGHNVLLVTIDSLRYDHTSLGGHASRRGRDTTPNLAKLAASSVSFAFANAPSAGTMASVPSILTSRFFHSGIALDEKVSPGMPPRLKEENVLLAEIMKRTGYATGAVLGHVYFEDFGLAQGFDSYDNSLGKTHDAAAVTSPGITDRALAFVRGNAGRKWFLWVHYLDPHAAYVAHPELPSFGDTEEDRYDGEIAFTDRHFGRLVDALSELGLATRTIIAVTADHGDGFGEHGFTNHGQALYGELLHVPLILSLPGVAPRVVQGPVTPMDLVPTLSELARADVSELHFEGESLVPELFHGHDDADRVVFAETNWPRVLRAAIGARHKLVFHLEENVYEAFDLAADPREQRNLWPARTTPELEALRVELNDWLERVYYVRDRHSNQVMTKLEGVLLDRPPDPAVRTPGATLDQGRVEVLGFDAARPRADGVREVSVYVRVRERPSSEWQLELEASGARAPLAATLLPPARWRAGDTIRNRFELRAASGAAVALTRRSPREADEVLKLGALPP